MEAVFSVETLVNLYRTTRHYILEDGIVRLVGNDAIHESVHVVIIR
jgi:hypothetical protein